MIKMLWKKYDKNDMKKKARQQPSGERDIEND